MESNVQPDKVPGLLFLPPSTAMHSRPSTGPTHTTDGQEIEPDPNSEPCTSTQRTLYDPRNPTRPIIIEQPQVRPECGALVAGGAKRTNDESHSVLNPCSYLKPEQLQWLKDPKLAPTVVSCLVNMRALLENGIFVGMWTQFEEVRAQVFQLLEKLLIKEIWFAHKVDIVNRCWNFVCHDRIVELRARMASGDNNEDEKSKLHERTQSLIKNGIKEFKRLFRKIEKRYALEFENGDVADLDRKGQRPKYWPSMEEAYKLCVFVGDLARYKSEFTNSTNFDEAQRWYKKAQRISPDKGRAFNQLAIIAMRRKHTLDVIYFNMRNLMSSTPYDATMKTLMHIFDVSKNKVELRQARLLKAGRYIAGVSRREIWIPPDSKKPLLRPSLQQPNAEGQANEEQELRSKDSDVYDDLVLSFIHTLGKLVNRKGMDSFHQCVSGMLCELRVLVQCSSSSITSRHYVQLVSMFVFATELLQVKAQNKRLQRAAMLEGMGMFGVLLERFIDLVENPPPVDDEETIVIELTPQPSPLPSPPPSPLPDDGAISETTGNEDKKESRRKPRLYLCTEAKTLLPPMKVWIDWLMNTPATVWHPAYCRAYLKVGTSSVNDPWGNLAKLMNILEEQDVGLPVLTTEPRDRFTPVQLAEEIDLAGCTPWMYSRGTTLYMPDTSHFINVEPRLHLRKLAFFCSQHLTNLVLPILGREQQLVAAPVAQQPNDDGSQLPATVVDDAKQGGEPQSRWVWYVTSGGRSDTKRASRASRRMARRDETGGRPASTSSTSTLAEIRDLLRRNEEIERGEKSLEREKQERLQAMLAESTVPRIMEVRPRYVVLDTNCFVDDLTAVEWIATFRAFRMLIPITVIKELRGLALGDANRQKPLPTGVADASQLALAFLETCEPGVISYIDMDGEIVAKDSPFLRDKDTTKTNDDRILQAALSLCRDQYAAPPDADGYIVRNVALITNDRTLRVKAITTNMPTKALCEFIEQLQLWFPLSQGPQRASD